MSAFNHHCFYLGVALALNVIRNADEATLYRELLLNAGPEDFRKWARRSGEIRFSGLDWLKKHYPGDYDKLFEVKE